MRQTKNSLIKSKFVEFKTMSESLTLISNSNSSCGT